MNTIDNGQLPSLVHFLCKMISLSRLVLALTAFAGATAAAGVPSIRHSTHRVRALADGSEIASFNPPSTFEVSTTISPRA